MSETHKMDATQLFARILRAVDKDHRFAVIIVDDDAKTSNVMCSHPDHLSTLLAALTHCWLERQVEKGEDTTMIEDMLVDLGRCDNGSEHRPN